MKKQFLLIFISFIFSFGLFATSYNIKPTQDVLNKALDNVIEVEDTFETNCSHLLFGIWPQTKKKDNVIINSSTVYDINGWKCYKGNDQCFYIKVLSHPYDNYTFSDGLIIEKDKEYYFCLEPILWRVLDTDYQNGKLLSSVKILSSGSFCTSENNRNIYLNNYEKSSLRAWLNGLNGKSYDVEDFTNNGFINKAFSAKGIDNIKTTFVDNSAKSIGSTKSSDLEKVSKYICNNTNDKIFLLSEEEVTNKNYGFSDEKENDLLRIRKTTDYARATVAYSNTSDNYLFNGWWWLRSPSYNTPNFALGVKYDGCSNCKYNISKDRKAGGIVPSLVISN